MAVTIKMPSARRAQIDRMHELGFGRIERLMALNGEPTSTPDTKFIEEHRFGAEPQAPRPSRRPNPSPRAQRHELLEVLERLGSGVVEVIEVQNG